MPWGWDSRPSDYYPKTPESKPTAEVGREDQKKYRFIFLHKLYEVAGANRNSTFNLFEIGRRVGMNNDLTNLISQYLFDEGLITIPGENQVCVAKRLPTQQWPYFTLTDEIEHRPYKWGESGIISITHKGIIEVEQALDKPESPTEHFPPQISYTINVEGDMIGSAIQQGAPKANQSITGIQEHHDEQQKVRVLFVSAIPKTEVPLEVIKECNSIRDRIMDGEYGDQFHFDQRHQVSVSEMDRHLLHYKPQILHFSGHGSRDGTIVFENSQGLPESTSIKTFSDLFRIVNGDKTMTDDKRIKLVFLNACYTEKQAKEIAKYVDGVIGMSALVGDEAARLFAESFYRAIGYGRSIKTAYDLGKEIVKILNIPEELTPRLRSMPGKDPAEIYLVKGKPNVR